MDVRKVVRIGCRIGSLLVEQDLREAAELAASTTRVLMKRIWGGFRRAAERVLVVVVYYLSGKLFDGMRSQEVRGLGFQL